MRKLGPILIAASIVVLIYAWSADFTGVRQTVRNWNREENRWGPEIVIGDDSDSTRRPFYYLAAGAFGSGVLLCLFRTPSARSSD